MKILIICFLVLMNTFLLSAVGLEILEGQNLNLGTFKSTEKYINTIFTLVNETSQAIEIDEIVTSCGCTVTKLSNKILNPSEEIPLKLLSILNDS